MALKLSETTDRNDLQALTELVCQSFVNNQFFWMNVGPRPENNEDWLKLIAVARDEWFAPIFGDPKVKWWKVVDTETGAIVGCGQIVLKDEPHPYADDKHDAPDSFKEGEEREYASQFIERVSRWRNANIDFPHLWVFCLSVAEEYRKRGIASMLLDEMHKHADEIQQSIFLTASEESQGLYPRKGYYLVDEFTFRPHKDNPGEDWKKMQREYPKARQGRAFFRPVGGKQPAGVPWPWEK